MITISIKRIESASGTRESVFVDSGAWIALIKRDDRLHDDARQYYDKLYAARAGLLTTNYIVAETATRLRYDAGLQAALDFRTRIDALHRVGRGRTIWIDERLEAQGWLIMAQYADIPLSLTDATSAAVARVNRITDMFGFDKHFAALGFVVAPSLS